MTLTKNDIMCNSGRLYVYDSTKINRSLWLPGFDFLTGWYLVFDIFHGQIKQVITKDIGKGSDPPLSIFHFEISWKCRSSLHCKTILNMIVTALSRLQVVRLFRIVNLYWYHSLYFIPSALVYFYLFWFCSSGRGFQLWLHTNRL